MEADTKIPSRTKVRLLSLDVMRGMIMILLAGESCAVYHTIEHATGSNWFINQFFHAPWHGLRFWDLVQPAFMLMAGSAMYISWHYKAHSGLSWRDNFPHILKRCIGLFVFGTALHCVYAGRLVWELWNVLTQLSITTLIAYLIIRKSFTWQLVFSLLLLMLTEALYRLINVAGFDQAFTEHHNFGAYADTLLMGKINADGWVAINCIPTTAHTIWGVLAGRLLVSSAGPYAKVKYLVFAGLIALIAGYSLDFFSITPIIKRISTSSFVLASGGWVLLMMAALYWLNDIRKYQKYAWLFIVIGMNPIFIYLFFETVGAQWLNGVVKIFVGGGTGFLGIQGDVVAVVCAFMTLALEWYLCFWLYKRKIFFKL